MIDTSAFQGKKAAYYTLGCKLNFSETSTFGKMLSELGVQSVKKGEKADICLINTCSVSDTPLLSWPRKTLPLLALRRPWPPDARST